MPFVYAFQPDEGIRHGFLRVLGEIANRARDLSPRSREPLDESIHEGRLLIKRARALLWFARPALGDGAYTRARAQLRKAAGFLAAQRDLAVTRSTLEQLAPKASLSRRAAVGQVRRNLASHSPDGPEEIALRQMLQKAMALIGQTMSGIKRSTPRRAAWPSPGERLKKAFHTMRKAGKKAQRTGRNADFHTWRKKAKRLLYLLELIQAEPWRRMRRVMKRLDKLQEILGMDHDGVVIGDHLRQLIPLSSSSRRVLRLLERRKKHLRKRAHKIGRRLDLSCSRMAFGNVSRSSRNCISR